MKSGIERKLMEFVKAVVTSAVVISAAPVFAELELQQPIDCTLDDTCLIQQFMDHDAGDGVTDFRCDEASYDGHKGTDFRVSVRDMRRGVDILAAADGVIMGVRNNMIDKRVQSDADRAAVAGKECGNGMVLRHAGGWETQYCHMKQGSVIGATGDSVQKGDKIGEVGLSGRTQFAHLHLSVRKDGVPVDPFSPAFDAASCAYVAGASLWEEGFAKAFSYQPTKIAQVGLADTGPSVSDVMDGVWGDFEIKRTLPLVIYGLAVNGKAGDVMILSLLGPDGEIVQNNRPPLQKRKAQWFGFVGKRAPAAGWPRGEYVLSIEIQREGTVLHRSEDRKTLD